MSDRQKRWRENNRERYLELHAAAMRRFRAKNPGHDYEWRKVWRAANPEKVQAMNRKANRKYARLNPDKEAARRERFRLENPDYWRERRDKGREYERLYRERHPDRRSWHQRRLAKRGIQFVVFVESDACGVCHKPLYPDAIYPDPKATTVGHEPPLSVAVRDGWRIIAERPEHARCNLWKQDRLDCQLPAQLPDDLIQNSIAAAARWAPPVR